MKRLDLFVTVVLSLLVAPDGARAQTSIQTLRTNGPLSKRINIVFLSEGYTTNQLAQFPNDAIKVLTNLLATPPLREYSNSFNAFAISVASVQSGSDHYTPTTNFVNTYFNSSFDSYGIQRLITIPPNDRDANSADGQGRVNSLLATYMPQYDIVALIVNDTQYGGSGGFPLIASVNSSSPEIATHELGHAFAGLGDEYGDPYPGYPDIEEPNTTIET
ncbi:MAG TPA: M64 family metallopeptidase, partial [Verrucomicrobiae bacterium]|nr:M64 family metallopeptidase [Verrucomicrobiae bacterium]